MGAAATAPRGCACKLHALRPITSASLVRASACTCTGETGMQDLVAVRRRAVHHLLQAGAASAAATA